MARSDAIWGIDIGNCSLKALRCRVGDDGKSLVATAFDYIEYPKLLTQPGAEPAELIRDALKQFLSRNNVRGERVAISVSGQNGLARFIKLPPVESKKIPDIVRYEAKQQIPFELDDVVWDYQRMGGGSEEEGFALEIEVGLFAMKRDQVFRALEPFEALGIDVDFVQLSPLALYNFVLFDQLRDLPPIEEYDPDNPPPSIVLISMGTDATDLVVTNGYRVWQRSVPLGGNHFTKALTKELKLTFAKAEHLKRNATSAQDPKAVFQAMRPVFSDLLTEVQRSLAYFMSVDRSAKIGRVLAMGNAMKLPGLRRYLSQGLGYEVGRLEGYAALGGPEVLKATAFQENEMCFGVCYGLAVQGLKKAALRTNLLPKEIIKDRLIREKKPWAVAAVAVLLTACTVGLLGMARSLATVAEEDFKPAKTKAQGVIGKAEQYTKDAKQAVDDFDAVNKSGQNLVENVEGRVRWLELLSGLSQCLPSIPERAPVSPDKVTEAELERRPELHLVNLDCRYVENLDPWLSEMKSQNLLSEEDAKAVGGGDAAAAPDAAVPAAAPVAGDAAGDAAGAGGAAKGAWVVQLIGYHYHNDRNQFGEDAVGVEYVRNTLVARLRGFSFEDLARKAESKKEFKIKFYDESRKDAAGKPLVKEELTMRELGVSFPVVVDRGEIKRDSVTLPSISRPAGKKKGEPGAVEPKPDADSAPTLHPRRQDFKVLFVWQPVPFSQREQKRKEAASKAAAEQSEKALSGAAGR